MDHLDPEWPTWKGVPYATQVNPPLSRPSSRTALIVMPPFPQSVATSIAGPASIGITLKLLLTGLAFGNFGQYLTSPLYARDPRAHKALLWGVIALLTAFVVLDVKACVRSGVSQDWTEAGMLGGSGEQAVGPVLGGVVAGVVQGFLLVRAGRVSASRDREGGGAWRDLNIFGVCCLERG